MTLFVRPNRLIGDIVRTVKDIIATGSVYSDYFLTKDKIVIDMICELYVESEDLEDTRERLTNLYNSASRQIQEQLDQTFNRSRQFTGIGGIYQIYNPRITSVTFENVSYNEDEFGGHGDIHIIVELDYQLIRDIPIRKEKESVARGIIKERYPRLYDVLEDPNFTTRKIRNQDLLNEVNYIEDFEFPITNIRKIYEDLKYTPDNIKDLLIQASLYNQYPFLYSKIKDLNVNWDLFLFRFQNMMRITDRWRDPNTQANLILMIDFLKTGNVTRSAIMLLIHINIPELSYALLETNDPQLTLEDRNNLAMKIEGSKLLKRGYLP